jgi:MbtH protein
MLLLKTLPQNEPDSETTYLVVLSEEGRYSIWPDYKNIPWGWKAEGTSGPKQVCLDHIDKVWTDMRPLSLQRQMDGA